MARAGDPKTSVRWNPANYVWLAAEAARRGGDVGIGTVVQAIVTAARLQAEASVPGLADSTQVKSGVGVGGAGVPGQTTVEEMIESTAAAGTVAAGVAPAPRPGAAPVRDLAGALLESLEAPRRKLARLDVVVARVIAPGAGPIAPVDRARAMRLIKDGKVEVSGVGRGEKLEPARLVGPGEVVVHQ